MSYEVIVYRVGSTPTQTYRFKTREEAEEWYLATTAPSTFGYSSRKATHYLSWGEGETSIGGKVPPPGCPAVVMEFDVVTEPPSKKKEATTKKKAAAPKKKALRPPSGKKKATPKWQYYLGNRTDLVRSGFSFRTKKEALLYRDALYRDIPLSAILPVIVKEKGVPNSQLVWEEDGVWYGSAEGTLPPQGEKLEIRRTFFFAREDLQMKRKEGKPEGKPTGKSKGKPKKSLRYRLHRFGLTFKTWEEAHTYLGFKLGAEATTGYIQEEVGEPEHQLIWVEDGVEYGSKDGLLPPPDIRTSWAALTDDHQIVTKKKPEVQAGEAEAGEAEAKEWNSYEVYGLAFKTRAEAETYLDLRGIDTFKGKELGSKVLPFCQLTWVEDGVKYGSAKGLLPTRSIPHEEIWVKSIHSTGLQLERKEGVQSESEGGENDPSETSEEGSPEKGQAGMDYLPYLLETDLRTPEDVLNWLIEYPGTDAAQATIDLQERLKRERGEALLRAAQAVGSKGAEKADIILAEEERLFSEMDKAIEVAEEASRATLLQEKVNLEVTEGASSEPSVEKEEPSAWVGAFGFLALLGLMGKRTSDPSLRKRVGVVQESEVDSWGSVEPVTEEYGMRYSR